MKRTRPSDLELQVLSVLWDRGPSTVRDVLDALPDGKKRAYTTVLSVMQVMENKGLLRHKRQGLTHVYQPKVRRESVLKPMMKDLVRNVFGGSPASALQFLLEGGKVDADELAQIRALIDEHGSRSKGKGDKS